MIKKELSLKSTRLSTLRASRPGRYLWRFFFLATALAFIASMKPLQSAQSSSAAKVSPFADGERVLFLGDSITRGGAWYSLIGLYYATRFPNQKNTWINAGISGDTASGALQRLDWDVLAHKPDTVVIMFGMNECARPDLPGAIGSDERVALYRKSMNDLIVALKRAGVRIVLCTPSPYDATVQFPGEVKPEINAALTKCAQIARELGQKYRIPVVDFNEPMNRIAAEFQKTNPTFTLIGNDRVHPGELGNTLMGALFLQAQGVPAIVAETEIDAATGKLVAASNAEVKDLQGTGKKISFTLKPNALPVPFEGKSRDALRLSPDNELEKAQKAMPNPTAAYRHPGWHHIPLQNALNREMLKVTNLPDGEYELLIDDIPVGRWNRDEWAKGVNLSGIRATPQYQQALKVANAHGRRHSLAASSRGVPFTRLYTLQEAGVDVNDEAAVRAALERLINDPAAADNTNLGSGGFAQGMAKKYFETLEKAPENEASIAKATDEILQSNKPVPHRYEIRPVQHPVPAEQRQAAFDARKNPDLLQKNAAAFLDLLILDKQELLRSNLRMRKELQKIVDLRAENKPVEALNAWRDYTFEKLRNPAAFGLPEELLRPKRVPPKEGEQEALLARAEELMLGKVDPNAEPMQPGSVWIPTTKGIYGLDNKWRPATFEPLIAAYEMTGERRSLDQWIAYMDDWAMNEVADGQIDPNDLGDNTNRFNPQIYGVYQTLATIADKMPLKTMQFPADSLARIQTKLIRDYPPGALLYFDSNPQNWTPHTMTHIMESAMLMDEFKAAEYIFNRARHRHESYGTIEFLPDGSETEHALWYNRHVYTGNEYALHLAETRRKVSIHQRVGWEKVLSSPFWDHQQRRVMKERARYLLQMLTPQSQNPIGNRNDQRVVPGILNGEEFSLFDSAPDLRLLTDTLRGGSGSRLPDFTMSAFPYSGSWLMRTGWGKHAGYGHFFCSPFPVGGHALPGLKGNNGFFLSIGGQDLLLAGGFGNYSYERSPIRVDGKEQFALAGIGHGGIYKGHKGFGVAYIDPQPPPWRSHSSPAFDFAEGVYDGPYGDFVDDHHDDLVYTAEFLAELARGVTTGIKHQRQVFFVKNPGLWITVDRLQSPKAHEYSLDWRVPTPPVREFEGKPAPRYNGKSYPVEAVKIDETTQSIITDSTEMPNLAIRHFGPKMDFSTHREDGEAIKDDFTLRYKLYDFWRISGRWNSTGSDVVVSLIEVIPPGAVSQIQKTAPLGNGKSARGFQATLTNGETISFLTSIDGSSKLDVAGVTANAETLLVAGNTGMLLGCTSFQNEKPKMPNFEFTLNPKNEAQEMIAIHSVIAPVKIAPARNVIAGAEPITLSCATEGVEIRYTLDGTEPTLESPLYTKPITIDSDTIVNARAFRPGLDRLPTNVAGTLASLTAVAYYKLQLPHNPVAITGQTQVKPGLKADYSEGDWKTLIFSPEQIKPQKFYIVKNLFDRWAPNPQKTVGLTYSGFLSIPEDGVYTFHAPEELVTSTQEPGYALRLFVGQEMMANNRASGRLNEWYPSTTRHGYGTWSIALKKGLQPFKAIFVDYRTNGGERFNHPGLKLNTMWDGKTPNLTVSGPNLEKQPIPVEWFKH